MSNAVTRSAASVPELGDALNRQSVKAKVAEKLSGLIASGVLGVGDELPSERDLARAWQVSRDTVRGGVQILAQRGILAVSHGARTRVVSDYLRETADAGPTPPRINAYDVHQINRARQLIEFEVVGLAAEHIDNETLGFLKASLEAQKRSVSKPIEFLINDREFHFAIYRAAGNDVLADMTQELYGYMMPSRVNAMGRVQAIDKSIGDHERILAALSAGDSAETRRCFAVHIERIYRTTLQLMAE